MAVILSFENSLILFEIVLLIFCMFQKLILLNCSALIAASQNDCLEEVLTIVAFMSTDSVFVSSTIDREQTNLSRRKFEAPEGDHCTLLKIYRGYRLARKEKKLEVINIFLSFSFFYFGVFMLFVYVFFNVLVSTLHLSY